MSTPDFQHIIDHQLYLLRESMTGGTEEETDAVSMAASLLRLNQALKQWDIATKEYEERIPQAAVRKAQEMRRLGTVSSVAEMAAIDTATRRYYLVDMVLYLMREAVEILEQEGKPPLPPPDLRLGKMRTEGVAK